MFTYFENQTGSSSKKNLKDSKVTRVDKEKKKTILKLANYEIQMAYKPLRKSNFTSIQKKKKLLTVFFEKKKTINNLKKKKKIRVKFAFY